MLNSVKDKAEQGKQASLMLSILTSEQKNKALMAIAKELDNQRVKLISENEKDMIAAARQKLEPALMKRLKLDDEKIDELISGLEKLKKIEEPVGQTLKSMQLDDGFELYCVSCPLGVIGVIFESRPDALVQISSLCLKSGNAVMLKGGSEAAHTNLALFELIAKVTEQNGIPKGWIQLLEDRNDVKKLLLMDKYVDMIVPRGSNDLVKFVMENTRIPVLGHSDGVCHTYVDSDIDVDMAVRVCYDAKCQYPATCNAMETLLVHKDIASEFLPKLKDVLDEAHVRLLGDDGVLKVLSIEHASEKDWSTEYGDLTLSIKVVDGIDDAIVHINKYGSRHTDAIVTKNKEKARKFMDRVDSANVFWNCSTRFSDGYRYGMGAEVGISTSKIHARGPVGVEGLLTYKWKLIGNGNIVSDYSGKEPKRKFVHKRMEKEFPL